MTDVPRLTKALADAGVPHDIREYPDAGHAFLNDHDGAGDRNPVVFVVMGKFACSSGYHEPSAATPRAASPAALAASARSPVASTLLVMAATSRKVTSSARFGGGWRAWSSTGRAPRDRSGLPDPADGARFGLADGGSVVGGGC